MAGFTKKIYHLSTTSKQKHKWEYIHDGIGYNHRMSNLSAALGLAQLENLKEFLKFKRKLYNKYRQAFKSFKKGRIFKEPKNSKSNYLKKVKILVIDDLINRKLKADIFYVKKMQMN